MAGSGYVFYLDKCLLPVTPEKLQISIKNENKTVKLINDGQINLLKKAGLTEIEFECMIPQVKHPFAVYQSGFQSADHFLNYFERLKTSKKPFQFIVSRSKPNGSALFGTNIKVSMEDYRIVEDVKEGFDLTIKVKLKQYREFGTKSVSIKGGVTTDTGNTTYTVSVDSTRSQESAPSTNKVRYYTVKEKNTLFNIAKEEYGDGSKYKLIMEANRNVIKDPCDIKPGTVLKLPGI